MVYNAVELSCLLSRMSLLARCTLEQKREEYYGLLKSAFGEKVAKAATNAGGTPALPATSTKP